MPIGDKVARELALVLGIGVVRSARFKRTYSGKVLESEQVHRR